MSLNAPNIMLKTNGGSDSFIKRRHKVTFVFICVCLKFPHIPAYLWRKQRSGPQWCHSSADPLFWLWVGAPPSARWQGGLGTHLLEERPQWTFSGDNHERKTPSLTERGGLTDRLTGSDLFRCASVLVDALPPLLRSSLTRLNLDCSPVCPLLQLAEQL